MTYEEAMKILRDNPDGFFACVYLPADPHGGPTETVAVAHKSAVLRGLLLSTDTILRLEDWSV